MSASDDENELLNGSAGEEKDATPSQVTPSRKLTIEDLAETIVALKNDIMELKNPAPREKKRKRDLSPAEEDEVLSLMPDDASEDELLNDLIGKPKQVLEKVPDLEQDLYNNLASSFDDSVEEKGPEVSPTLARLLNDRYGTRLPYEKLKEKMVQHPVPKNCAKMSVPKTNEHVYRALKPQVRQADTRLRNTQQTILKSAVAVTKATNKLINLKEKNG